MQGWTATIRHLVTIKEREKYIQNLIREESKIKGASRL